MHLLSVLHIGIKPVNPFYMFPEGSHLSTMPAQYHRKLQEHESKETQADLTGMCITFSNLR